ncbi:hypothetical protein JOF29_006195 [Kribbella aluminosa]|uniref:Nucleotidyltransferase AbiEii toxin of type IV toxin-antitoxin system n=1 Tax=Kribbella aluminosa TaxID=416017 RepID=A0ABS4UTW5_9ACTN|nr:hypothetical protein [Kribbella aluminosa]MBP2355085.1 hypothetical protein [Kribbella aluminosa]
MTEHEGYADWRSLESAIKDAAKQAAQHAGPGISAASVDAKIRQARFDRFLSRVFAEGEQSEWLLKDGMSMLARVPRSRTTKDMDLAAQRATSLAEAETALTELVDVDPEVIEPANRLHLRRPLVTHPYRLYPVADQIADKVCGNGHQLCRRQAQQPRQGPGRPCRSGAYPGSGPARAAARDRRQTAPQRHRAVPSLRHPADWTRTYPATAKGVPLAESFTATTAAELAATFVDPALDRNSNAATWDPQHLTWVEALSGVAHARGRSSAQELTDLDCRQ